MTVFEYHDRTRHHLHRTAAGPGYLDWATMPAPFRRYAGAPVVPLPREARTVWPDVPFDVLYDQGAAHQPTDTITAAASPDLRSIGSFLRCSLGLSAWKQAGGERWALRVNPSSGNLHPTEAYVVAGPGVIETEAGGVYHYAPEIHALECRRRIDAGEWGAWARALPEGGFLAGLASIAWREAWKYGERAWRYCQHDIGHAVAALRYAAALFGWDLAMLPAWSDAAIAALLGLGEAAGDAEPEDPACLLVVSPSAIDRVKLPGERADLVRAATRGPWLGEPNRLSPSHEHDWPILVEVARAATKTTAPADGATYPPLPSLGAGLAPATARAANARHVLLSRRSAVAFDDGAPPLPLDTFLRMMGRLLPRAAPPWDALFWAPAIHLAIFVHKVSGLAPGLYALLREPEALADLRAAMQKDFAWEPADPAGDLPLYLLAAGDTRALAAYLSCGQAIAGDGAFSLGMLARFAGPIARHGQWFYRCLFWEAGAVGQVLYLEAEAAGVRGTGIGCYFDPAVHELIGLSDDRFQSLYHFTVGMAIEDARLQSRPGYDWD
jgi:SagB-type dehydrogenase family enzyme